MTHSTSVLRLLGLSLTLLLTACSTCVTCVKVVNTPPGVKLGSNTKLASYDGVIKNLAVFIVEPQAVTSMPLTGGYGRAPTAGRAAMLKMETVFKDTFTKSINAQGLPAELATSSHPNDIADIRIPAGATHLLILAPTGARTQCASGCQSSVDIHAVLKDLTAKEMVWEAYLSVTEGPIFGTITDEDAEKSATLVLEAFRKYKLAAGG